MPFDSPDVPLSDLLARAGNGKLQLPDFQREWKWDTDRIASLLASIAQGHPIGVIMMLEVGGYDVNFAPCPLAGVDGTALTDPEWLILDGQQRMTSLYQALASGNPVDTTDGRGKKIRRWYYLDIDRALSPNGDLDEAVLAVPEDRIVRTFRNEVAADYSTRAKECEARVFPLNMLFGIDIFDWQNAFVTSDPDHSPDRQLLWKSLFEQILRNFVSYTVPVIVLTKDTPKEAVCAVFEKVNTQAVVLNVFELLTATYAVDNFRLKKDWEARKERLTRHRALRSLEDTDFLQAVTLLATRARRQEYLASGGDPQQAPGIGCRRRDILRLERSEYEHWADTVEEALDWSAAFLAEQHIFQARDLPYRTQLVPLSAIRATLGPEASNIGVSRKLSRWYWCGVLGELYGGTTETRFARDLAEVVGWVEGGPEPSTVTDASFNSARLLSLGTRNSAAYKGLYALLMRDGCRDWLYDQTIDLASFFNHRLDIHHIFPKKWCNDHAVDAKRRESILNKTAIAARTNQIIGGRAPSEYLPRLEKRADLTSTKLNEILATHAIAPQLLRADDFNAFFDARRQSLLRLIRDAMGKDPILDESLEAPDLFEEDLPEIDVEDVAEGEDAGVGDD